MSVSAWQQPETEKSVIHEYEVAVIGAGIVGAYTAYRLGQRGRKVALVESRFPAAGATGRNAGMMLMGLAENYYRGIENWGRANAFARWQLTVENRQRTLELIDKFSLEDSLERCGSVILGIDAQEAQELEASYALLKEDGFKVGFLSGDIYERGFTATLVQPEDCGINPAKLVQSLVANFTDFPGCRLYDSCEVFAIEDTVDGKLLVRGRGQSFKAEQVALCTNAFSPLINPFFKDKIFPKRAQILLTTPLPYTVLNTLAYANYGYEYFRQLSDGSFMLGGCRAAFQEQEVGWDENPSDNVQNALEQFLARHFPDVASSSQIVRRWAGIMGFTEDSQPLIGSLPQQPQVHYACGFTGHGLAMGIVSAEKMLTQM